jgi:hypothetical protein
MPLWRVGSSPEQSIVLSTHIFKGCRAARQRNREAQEGGVAIHGRGGKERWIGRELLPGSSSHRPALTTTFLFVFELL